MGGGGVKFVKLAHSEQQAFQKNIYINFFKEYNEVLDPVKHDGDGFKRMMLIIYTVYR